MKNWIKQNKINLIVMILYSICSLVILMFHESWRDEAQSWLIVKDLDFLEIIQQMKYEGHFLLWYIIIMPFAKLGLPYETTKIISWVIVNISVWLILKNAPFKWWIKTLFIFSFPMLYLYPAISRCYCIIPLAITLIAINYKNRKTKPIHYILSIILLLNTHIIMLGLVGMLLLTFYIEQIRDRKENTIQQNKKIIISFFIACVLLILSMLPLVQSLMINKEIRIDYSFTVKNIIGIFIQIIYIIICIFGIKNIFLISIILGLICICFIFEFKYYIKNLIIIFISILYQFIIYGYIYYASYQRANTILMIIFLFAWIQKKEINKEYSIVSKILIILLINNVIFGIYNILLDIEYKYSSAKQTAEFINENIEESSIMISNNMPTSSAIIPYIKDFKIWNPQKEDYFTYVIWDDDNEKSLYTDFKYKIEEKIDKNEKLYYIYAKEKEKIEQDQIKKLEQDKYLTKIFESDKSMCEEYIIYKINRE